MSSSNKNRILRVFIIFALIVLPAISYSQWTLDVNGSVKKEETKKRFEGVTITVKRNGSVWKTVNSDESGKFDVSLPPNAIYLVEFSKPGHVTKRIEFSTKNVPPEDAKYGFEFPMEMNLFEEIDGLDVSILNQPIAKVAFDPSTGYMDYNPEYTKSVKKELDRLKKELEEKLKSLEEERKQKQKDYDAAIVAADKAFKSENWTDAKSFYEKASQIFPAEDYPLFQLADIEDKLADLEAADKKYKSAIEKGDEAFKEREWEKAINSYEIALEVKDDDYPKNKIKEIEDIIANEEKVNEEYNELIADADNAFNDKDYEKAKEKYSAASTLKDYEEYPKQKLKEIDEALAALAETEKAYNDAIAEADGLFNEKNYEGAIASYTKASEVKPDESYPKEKIEEANNLLAEQKAREEEYKGLIATADAAFDNKDYETAQETYEEALEIKTDDYPKSKIEEIKTILAEAQKLDEDYKAAIEQGDNAFDGSDYEASQVAFEKALTLKPEESYPKEKIEEIKVKLEELAAQKELNEKYDALIASADEAFSAKSYDKAIVDYKAALELKSNENYPAEKITEIEQLIEAAARLDEEYAEAIKEGDAALSSKEYQEAKSFYEKAISLKEEEQYPKDKLAEVNALIDEMLAKMEVDEKYNTLIESADNAFDNEIYDKAKTDYNAALGVKPNETYPQEKLNEIEEILAKLKKEEEDALAAEAARKKREYYEAVVAQADAEFDAANYDESKKKYNEALGIIPDEQYPKDKLAEIKIILDDLAAKKAAEEASLLAQKEKDEKYNAFIASADVAFNGEDYDKAKTNYNSALGVKPNEQYPKDKLLEIEEKLAELAAKEEEIRLTNNAMKQKQAQYDSYIKQADENFNAAQYEKAKSNYEAALGLMPLKVYPKNKISEIESILAELAMKEKNAKEAELAEQQKREAYENLIYEGDRAMKIEDYKQAQGKFNAALDMYPDEKYPSEKLAEILALMNKKNEEKETEVVAVNTNSNSRAKINDAKEREIERRMAKIREKTILAKDEKLAEEKKGYAKQQEIIISASEDRLEKNQDELNDFSENRIAMQNRGNKYHLQNSKELESTKKKLKKAEGKRIKASNKWREKNNEEIAAYMEAREKFAKKQKEISEEKADNHYIYADNIIEAKRVMMERGDKMRAENRKDLEKLAADTKKNQVKNYEIAVKNQININEYKEYVAKETQILVKASIDRRADNQEELDELNKEMIEMRQTGDENYKINFKELAKFRDRISEIEQKRIEKADKARMQNQKDKEKMQAQIVKNQERQQKKYYKDVKYLDKYKQNLTKQNYKLIKEADKRRLKADKDLIKQKEAQSKFVKSQEPRYKELDKQLAEVRKQNTDFIADKVAYENKRRMEADREIRDVYRGEAKPRTDELAKKYPEGITEEIEESGSSVTIKRYKVTGSEVDVYERVFYPWGGTYYYKNGDNITKTLWDKESIE